MVVLYNNKFNIIFYVAASLGCIIVTLCFIYLFAVLVKRSKYVTQQRLHILEDLENTKNMNKTNENNYIKTHMVKHIMRDDSFV